MHLSLERNNPKKVYAFENANYNYIYAQKTLWTGISSALKGMNTIVSACWSCYELFGIVTNVFQTKLGFSKVAFYPQNLKKKRNYADKSHF
jgi:uncharacterized membrane-anchored protein YitT (DUF2179 family)